MRLLIDTNIFLEVLLGQEKAREARELLSMTEKHELYMSDYSLHSIGLLLFRRGQHEVFRQFLADIVTNACIHMLALSAGEMEAVINAAQNFSLDFDDAYQYAVAERYGLTLVSYDSDFDRTERGHKTPDQLVSE